MSHRVPGTARRIAAPLWVVLALAVAVWPTRNLGAATGGAGATGHGDEIITSILAAAREGGTGGGAGGPGATCRTHVLTDRQVTYLIHVAATMPELLEASFLDAIERFANSTVSVSTPAPGTVAPAGTAPPASSTPPASSPPPASSAGPSSTTAPTSTVEPPSTPEPEVTYWDLTVRVCGGVADTMSVRSRVATGSLPGASVLAGGFLRHTTRLPAPVIRLSPPPRTGPLGVEAATIVGEPVFFSVDAPGPVIETIPYGGRTVEVRAAPDHIEVFSGEPAAKNAILECAGLGSTHDPSSPLGPYAQAYAEGACAVVFHQRTGPPRRDHWLGYVALEWSGRFRVDGGPWRPLDGLFSTSVFAVSVGEVDTVVSDEG